MCTTSFVGRLVKTYHMLDFRGLKGFTSTGHYASHPTARNASSPWVLFQKKAPMECCFTSEVPNVLTVLVFSVGGKQFGQRRSNHREWQSAGATKSGAVQI